MTVSQAVNASSPYLYPAAATITLGIVMSAMAIVTTVFNAFTLVAFAFCRTLRNYGDYFILNLAVADLGIGLMCIPPYIPYALTGRWEAGKSYCLFWLLWDYILPAVSTMNMCIISIDRYLLVARPIWYRSHQCKRLLLLMTLSPWTVALCVYTLPILLWETVNGADTIQPGKCHVPYAHSIPVLLVGSVFEFVVPFVIMATVNILIFVNIRRRRKKRWAGAANGGNSLGPVSVFSVNKVAPQPTPDDPQHQLQTTAVVIGSRTDGGEATNDSGHTASAAHSQLEVEPSGGSLRPRLEAWEQDRASELSLDPRLIHAPKRPGESTQQLDDLTQPSGSPTQRSETPIQPSDSPLQQSGNLSKQSENPSQQSANPTRQSANPIQQSENPVRQSVNFAQKSGDLTQQTDSVQASFQQKPSARHNKPDIPGSRTQEQKQLRERKTSQLQRDRKAARSLFVLVLVFALCWMPFEVMSLVSAVCSTCIKPVLYEVSFWLLWLNSTINPVLYPLLHTRFRQAFHGLFDKIRCRRP